MKAELGLLRRHALRLLGLTVICLIGGVLAVVAPAPELRLSGCVLLSRSALVVIGWTSRSMGK